MLRVGLTGGLASGKSFVGQALADLGCHLIQADELGHEVLQPGGEAYQAVIAAFGPSILEPGGEISRSKLAAEVFASPERLRVLNGIVHPPVIRREEELIREFASRDPDGIVVVEAAILIETGSFKRFDRLVLVVCAREQQIERAMRRNGASREDVVARLDRQMPLHEKRKFADHVIDTSGSKEDTLEQVRRTYDLLRQDCRKLNRAGAPPIRRPSEEFLA